MKKSYFDRKIFLSPLFEKNKVYFETVYPFEKVNEYRLLFNISKIVKVTSYKGDVVYKEGKDYFVKNGLLFIPDTSSIHKKLIKEYYLEDPGEYSIEVKNEFSPNPNKKMYLAYGEKDFMTKDQIVVTYEHLDKNNFSAFKNQKVKLKRTLNLLENEKNLTICFYGDSITCGCNSSGTEYGESIPPYAESWPIMVTRALEDIYSTKINYINTAVGGTNTEWGLSYIKENVLDKKPDLLVLGFGMNDGNLEPSKHKELILKIIDIVHENLPLTEIILVSTSIPNLESTWSDWTQRYFIDEYKKIDKSFVAISDVTSAEEKVLERKSSKDLLANNINHPNDFLVRIYAQCVLYTIVDKYE